MPGLSNHSEDALIEQRTIALFRELGWQTIDCMAEGQTGPQAGLSGRGTLQASGLGLEAARGMGRRWMA